MIYKNTSFIQNNTSIDEGAVFMTALALPFVIGGAIALSSKIDDKRDSTKIKAALSNACKENESINQFDKEISSISFINKNEINDFIEKFSKNPEKDKKLIDNNNTICIAIKGKEKDKMLAYAYYNKGKNTEGYIYQEFKYYINILDQKYAKDKDVSKYVSALVEKKIGYYGDGINYFLKKSGKSINSDFNIKSIHKSSKHNIEFDWDSAEGKQLIGKLDKFSNLLYTQLKTKIPKNKYSCTIDKSNDGRTCYIDISINDKYSAKEFKSYASPVYANLLTTLKFLGYDITGYKDSINEYNKGYKDFIFEV